MNRVVILMKKVLWVSRHEMTPSQRADLERVMQDSVELNHWRNTVEDVQELAPAIEQADSLAVVLPLQMLAQVFALAGEKPVLQAISGRERTGRTILLSDGRQEPEFLYVHRGWQQLIRLDLETRML